MKKIKYLLIVFLLLIIPYKVNASNICTSTKYNKLKTLAYKTEITYELKFDENHNAYFEVTVLNMTDDLILQYNSAIYEANESGRIVLDTRFPGGATYELRFYGGYSNSCVEQYVYTKKITLPTYNVYSERDECIEYEEFPLCNKYYSGKIESEEQFLLLLESYKESLEKEVVDLNKDNRSIFEKFIDFYKDNIFIALPITILIIVIIGYAVTKKLILRKKRTKIDIEY